MITQNLIIFKFNTLYRILEELDLDLNFKITLVDNQNSLNEKLKNLNNHLIISNKKYPDIDNQYVLDNTPINILNLVEKLNIEFLKIQFNNQSEVKVKNYTIDLNSREMLTNNTRLKLTEKEITTTYLSKSNKPSALKSCRKSMELPSDMETHTLRLIFID